MLVDIGRRHSIPVGGSWHRSADHSGGRSGAQHVAALAPGAHVVKAFHLFPAEQWSDPESRPVTVTICGDHDHALHVTQALARDTGTETAVLGRLDRARQ